MELEIYQVDSFTNKIFKGNPAGVCITQESLDTELMLSISREMAVSETAFLSLQDMNLRWFTPETEVKLCGHGTLAVAHVLKAQGKLSTGDKVTFQTLSGELKVKVLHDSYELDLPSPKMAFDTALSDKKRMALGLSEHQIVSVCDFETKQLVEVIDENVIVNLNPDFSSLLSESGRGIVVTSQSTSQDYDIISRYFAPWVGVNEDPVTGSAHCALSAYWFEKLNASKLTAYQASSRGGYLDLEYLDNGRVKIKGQAVTSLKGTLFA
ncbi:isomerase [Vibrio zhanjiangensis]|uniref:Isomerase n=1 Tax=Vibrio zhanjiangensis TaxID=1046128 RepID=A0ABQ6ETZ8_9VIBR|nr:PhzF family phenazine biosynthesis protein [Vibrio zhanjiangensis]GLT16615.1 isomerase [Vibrio zhanjiangensis]